MAPASGPIRLFYVIGTLDVGGAEMQLVELVARLDPARFEAVVCCLASRGPLAARLEGHGVRVHALDFTGFRRKALILSMPHALRSLGRLFRLIRAERPHIIHGILFWAYILAAFVGRAARVPVIVASRRSLGLFKADKPHYLWIERRADRLTDLFIANSEAVRLDTIEREGVDPARVLVVHNGVDFGRFENRAAQTADLGSAPRVIVVSNLIHYKGHEYFLRAWPRVIERFPQATALLVGQGVMESPLRALAKQLGITASVRFLGSRTDVPDLLAASDLYVHPSLQEGYSNAVLEAMAAGRPVVVTAVGGNAEAVVHGDTGLLAAPADAAALGTEMLRVLEDPEWGRQLGSRAAQAVRRRFDIATVVQTYQTIYERLAAGEAVRYDAGTGGVSQCAV